ncbi:MAG: hypothetical protein AAFX03_11635 [Pseudomonadota bacterium]
MKAAFKRTHAAHGFRKAGAPTPLLAFLAGDHAEQAAHVWPAPHEGFFALPAARRHAAAMLLRGFGGGAGLDIAGVKAAVERDRDARLAERLIPVGETAGLIKALGKMGERLWVAEDYDRFLELFGQPNANRVLRHLETVTPERFAPLAALPGPLREAAIVANVASLPAAEDLATAFDLVLRMRGAQAGPGLVERWSRAKDTARLFNMAAEDLTPEVFRAPTPAPELPAPFEAVRTRKQLFALAMDFKNCLRDFTNDIAVGRMAVFAWRGAPNAAVALNWDQAGWRLAEAEGRANEELEPEPLRLIVEAVAAAGVRTGPAVNVLIQRLQRRAGGDSSPAGVGWIERLELGDLWD